MQNIHFANNIPFNHFQHLEIQIEPEFNAVWVYLNAVPRPCITMHLLDELKIFQHELKRYKGKLPYRGNLIDIDYHIVTSRHAVFSFGGDLEYFLRCIENREAEKLRAYGRSCIDTMYPNLCGFDNNITTISLVNGNALGGGFEAALSSHVLIAHSDVHMGLPEILFNLFPGMGAYNLLAQRLNPAMAEKIMSSGKLYTAEELHQMGLVDVLCNPGEGMHAVHHFINTNKCRLNSQRAIRQVRQVVNPVDYQQLLAICDIWVDTAMQLTDRDKRIMSRLIKSQFKYVSDSTEPLQARLMA